MTTIDDAQEPASVAVQTRHVLLVSQSLFFLALLWCIAIYRGPEAQNDGISFYGVYHRTIPILVGGYTVAAIGLWRTAGYLRLAEVPRSAWLCLRSVAVGLFVLLATPYDRGPFLDWAHMTAGVAGALAQLVVSWSLARETRSTRSAAGLSLQLAGGLLCAASLPDWHFAHLLQGEIIYQLGFSWCLLEWTRAMRAAELASV